MKKLIRAVAVLMIVAITLLSLLPKEEMVRTGFNSRMEHVVAYAGATPFEIAALAGILGGPATALGMSAYAGLMEIGQLFSPGRKASVWDWAAGTIGAFLGLGIHTLVTRHRGPPAEQASSTGVRKA